MKGVVHSFGRFHRVLGEKQEGIVHEVLSEVNSTFFARSDIQVLVQATKHEVEGP